MFEQAILAEQFEQLLRKQREIAEAYVALIETTEDPDLREQLVQLRREKDRHVRSSERLLEIVP